MYTLRIDPSDYKKILTVRLSSFDSSISSGTSNIYTLLHTLLTRLRNFRIVFHPGLHSGSIQAFRPYFAFRTAPSAWWSFAFYIPFNDQSLTVTIIIISRFTPSPAPLRNLHNRRVQLTYHQGTILNSPKLFCKLLRIERQGFTTGAIFTIQLVSIILTIYFIHVIFHPSRPAVEAGDTRLQRCELIHHTAVGILTVCSARVRNSTIMYPHSRFFDTVHFALLATYGYFSCLSTFPDGSRGRLGADTTLSPLTMNFSVMEYT